MTSSHQQQQNQMALLCHQVYLTHPKATFCENAEVAYVLVRFVETEDDLMTDALLIAPQIPEGKRGFEGWMQMSMLNQHATYFFDKAHKLAEHTGEQIVQLHARRKPGESLEDFTERVRKHLHIEKE